MLTAIDLAMLACPESEHHRETGLLLLRHCPGLKVLPKLTQQTPPKRSDQAWTKWVAYFEDVRATVVIKPMRQPMYLD